MRSGASTPEELESLLEDAFVTGDSESLTGLFDAAAVLVPGFGALEVRGSGQIARHANAFSDRGDVYLADPLRVLQTRDIALVIAQRAVNVMRRGGDHRWRYAVSLLSIDNTTEGSNR
jgi:hypothetical protein